MKRKKWVLGTVVLAMIAMGLSGCGSSSKNTTTSTTTQTPITSVGRTLSDVTLKAKLTLSDGSTITAPTAKICRRIGGLSLSSGANAVSGNALSIKDLFAAEGVHDMAIYIEQNGKKYIWATPNVTISKEKDVNLGAIVLCEIKRVNVAIKTSESLDGLRYNIGKALPSVMGSFLNEDTQSAGVDSTTGELTLTISCDYTVGNALITISNLVGTYADNTKVNFSTLTFSGPITNTTTSLGSKSLTIVP